MEQSSLVPLLLKSGLHSFENRLLGENAYEGTVRDVIEAIDPLLESLSVPERISRSTTFVDGVQQEDLWRRRLDYSPSFRLNGKDYYVGVQQIVDSDGKTRQINFSTGDGPENIHLAAIVPGGEFPNFPKIWGPRRDLANKEEMEDTLAFARIIALEAPQQAIERDQISLNWMDAQGITDPTILAKFKGQGLPLKSVYRKKPYELIRRDGVRVVANPDPTTGQWTEDVNGHDNFEPNDIVAWRQLGVILPEYYSRQKYPSLYTNR